MSPEQLKIANINFPNLVDSKLKADINTRFLFVDVSEYFKG